MRTLAELELEIQGLGILLYSPALLPQIEEGADHLAADYTSDEQVQKYIQAGTLVGFGTGTPGTFLLRFLEGAPEDARLQQRTFKLRLGLRVVERVCVRDLYDLMEWTAAVPANRTLPMKDGVFRLTLASDPPASGILGHRQLIEIFCEPVERFPELFTKGIPHLCGSS